MAGAAPAARIAAVGNRAILRGHAKPIHLQAGRHIPAMVQQLFGIEMDHKQIPRRRGKCLGYPLERHRHSQFLQRVRADHYHPLAALRGCPESSAHCA